MNPNEQNEVVPSAEPEQQQPVQQFTPPVSNQPVGEPSPAALSSDAMPTLPVKKSKKGLIIGLVLASVLLVGLVTAGVIFALVYNNPENAVVDAFSKALTAKSGNMSGTAMIKTQESSVKLQLDGASNASGQASSDVTVTVTTSGKDYVVEGHLVGTKDEVYVKLDDLRKLLNGTFGSEYSDQIETYYGSLLDKIDGKWVLVKQSDLEELSSGSVNNKESQCVQDEIGKLQTDAPLRNELTTVYKKHPLFTVASKGTDSDGNHYTLTPVSNEKAQEFLKAVVETKIFKAVDDCVSDDLKKSVTDNSDSDSDTDTSSDNATATIDVWVSGWSHTLNKISVNAKSDDTELTSEFRTKFNTNPSVTVPKNPTTVDELKSEIEKIQEQASSSDESPTSSSLYDYTY